jgi:hypothetical protein
MPPTSRVCVLVLLAACQPNGGKGTCDVGDVATGQAVATVDGADWTGTGATWRLAGSSLQINTVASDGWMLSLVAQATPDGTTASDALDAGEFPIDVTLKDGADGGWVLFYPDEGSSYGTQDTDGGTFTISGREGDDLLACFSFSAASGDGGTVTVEGGTMRPALAAR